MTWDEMVTVGRIVRPHGRIGDVVVDPETDFGDKRFRPGSTLQTRSNDGAEVRPLTVVRGREQQGRWIVGFEGVVSIEDAETLRDLELRIPSEALTELGIGAYYIHDLIGCEVRTVDGTVVGPVQSVDMTSSVPILVMGQTGDEVLVPFTDAICRRVDLRERRIEIDPPVGLMDVNRKRTS